MEDDSKITMNDVILQIKEQTLTKGDRWLFRTVMGLLVVYMGWSSNRSFTMSDRMVTKADKTEVATLDNKVDYNAKVMLPIETYREIERQRTTDITDFIVDIENNTYLGEAELNTAKKSLEEDMDNKIKLGTSNR